MLLYEAQINVCYKDHRACLDITQCVNSCFCDDYAHAPNRAEPVRWCGACCWESTHRLPGFPHQCELIQSLFVRKRLTHVRSELEERIPQVVRPSFSSIAYAFKPKGKLGWVRTGLEFSLATRTSLPSSSFSTRRALSLIVSCAILIVLQEDTPSTRDWIRTSPHCYVCRYAS